MRYKDFLVMLFDDDADLDNDGNGADDNKDTTKPEKKYTDDEVNAIIDKKFAEWQKKQKRAVDEAQKLASMSAQEKAEHERAEWEQKYNDLLAENTRTTLTIKANQLLTDDGVKVPSEIVAVLVGEDAETTKDRVTAFTKAFKQAVQDAVKDANKKSSPKTGDTSKTLTKSSILKIKDLSERQRLIKENIDLFTK